MAGLHLTTEQRQRLQRFALTPEEFSGVVAHLDECESCRAQVMISEAASQSVADLAADLLLASLEEPEHLENEQIAALVDGAPLDLEAQQAIRAHLEICGACQAKVRELETLRALSIAQLDEEIEPLPEVTLASGAALQDTGGPVLLKENEVHLAATHRLPPSLGKQLTALITNGIASQVRSVRSLLNLLQGSVTLTPVPALRSAPKPMPSAPANTAIRSARPILRWQAVPGAREYTVVVSRQVAPDHRELLWKQSAGEQTEAALPEEIALHPDRLYIWQVETMVQGAPRRSPLAWFSILSAPSLEKLEASERTYSDSALILLALYETYGLFEEAQQQLRRLADLNPDSALLRTMQDRLERMRNLDTTV